MKTEKSIIFLCLCSMSYLATCDIYDGIDLSAYKIVEDTVIMRAGVESCDKCILRKFPEVKEFIDKDVPLFHNVKYTKVNEALPELILYNKLDEEVERIPLDVYDREECNDLLLNLGFYKKSSKDEKVPEKYLNGPYAPIQKDEL